MNKVSKIDFYEGEIEHEYEDELIELIYEQLKDSELKDYLEKIMDNGWSNFIIKKIYENIEELLYKYNKKYLMSKDLTVLLEKLKNTLSEMVL